LSSIQQGIQSAHCLAEMFTKYTKGEDKKLLFDWAKNHKTMIVLNGGNSEALTEFYTLLQKPDEEDHYPFAKFNEDEQSLNNAITCVGIILPEKTYNTAKEIIECPYPIIGKYTGLRWDVIRKLINCRLAT